jgi:hypothetical protein
MDSEEKTNVAIAGPTILVLIQTCLLDTTFDYDKVFRGPSGPERIYHYGQRLGGSGLETWPLNISHPCFAKRERGSCV